MATDRSFQALRSIAQKRREACDLHSMARRLGSIPGRERDANVVSKEAAIVDAEVDRLVAAYVDVC